LDRDGTLIEDREYLRDPAGVRLLPGVADGLRRLREAGFVLVVATNQSGIGRGMFGEAEYQRVNTEMMKRLEAEGATLDAVYHCPAAPTEGEAEHPDRKPAPGMFLRAAVELDLDMSGSWVIGDSLRDLVAGRAAGCRAGILVRTGKPLPASIEALRKEWSVVGAFADAVALALGKYTQSGKV
jgi:D-glycero-D-manno-heptose 1,7-bisphosphate phosphatase